MSTESTPLIKAQAQTFSKVLTQHVVSPPAPTWESRSVCSTFFFLTTQTLKNHYWTLAACFFSAFLCAHNDQMSKSIFDPLIFKSIFVVFGFAIGFRNFRAHERRGMCLTTIRNICHAAWELLMLLPYDETRERMRDDLMSALEAIAEHVMRVADRQSYKYGLSGTEPPNCCDNSPAGCNVIKLGPSTLVAATLLELEDEMSRLQKAHFEDPEYGASQRYQRSFWAKKVQFDQEHYNLVNYTIPSVSDAYVVLINSSLFVFGLVLPWGLHCSTVSVEETRVMGAGTFLILNTIVVMWILLGLNTLASQHEDPLMPSYETIDVRQHVKVFREAVEAYDSARESLTTDPEFRNTVAIHQYITSPEHSV